MRDMTILPLTLAIESISTIREKNETMQCDTENTRDGEPQDYPAGTWGPKVAGEKVRPEVDQVKNRRESKQK